MDKAEASRQWRLNNPEKSRAATRKWRENNLERHAEIHRDWRVNNYHKQWMQRIKQRCIRQNIEFDLTVEDFEIPDLCPALGVPFIISDPNKTYTPSMDRIDPTKGYVKGNVRVITYRANQVKSNSTIEEMEKVLQYYRSVV